MKDILIIGNGFDLSHFLPTKYDHFMGVMQAIQKFKSLDNGMSFDDLFGELQITEQKFFVKTCEFYKCEELHLNTVAVNDFKESLDKNVWYRYFLDHVKEVKTWIDFEQKIEEALICIGNTLEEIDDKFFKIGLIEIPIHIKRGETENEKSHYLSLLTAKILIQFNLLIIDEPLRSINIGKFNSKYLNVPGKDLYGFNHKKYINFLQNELDHFIDIFNMYLTLIVDNLQISSPLKIEKLSTFSKVYSFNYTNTFKKFHNKDINIEYLHGKLGKNQNIVLGISEINNKSLINLKAYGFTKYYQKLLKNTDYNFLSLDLNRYKSCLEEINSCYIKKSNIIIKGEREKNLSSIENLKQALADFHCHFHIWGHSLDTSDSDYIKELFSFNCNSLNNIENKVKITIYHFDSYSKFELLANLIHILSRQKVEIWIKNKWLVFNKNPEIQQIIDNTHQSEQP